jgi:integrase
MIQAMRSRYQRGTIRIRNGKVWGEWRGEPGPDGKRPHPCVFLGKVAKGKTRNDWRDVLRPHIEAYYKSLETPEIEADMTLADFIERVYLPAHESNWAPTTSRSLNCNIRTQIIRKMGTLPLSSIGKAAIIDRLNDMRANGKAKRTIKVTKWLLHSIFEEALDNDLVAKTPVRRITALRNMPDGEETKPLTEDEVRRIYASTAGVVRLIWRLMIGCGLRPGELMALRRNDVGEMLRVDEAIGLGKIGPTKTRKTRYVPIAASLRAELEAWMSENKGAASAWLIPHVDGGHITVAYLRDQVVKATREATGILDLTLRRTRTTFGTLLSGDIKDVQDLMGHATAEMTLKHYKKAINSRQVEAIEELDERLTRPALKLIKGGGK